MRNKVGQQNLNKVKKVLQSLAYESDMRLRWRINRKTGKITALFYYKIGRTRWDFHIVLPLDKILSGKYSKDMIKYNVYQQLSKWLNTIYEDYKTQMSQVD